MQTVDLAIAAKKASLGLAALPTKVKNEALAQVAKALVEHANEIIAANKKDIERSEQENLATPLLKRLKFDEAKIKDVVAGIQSLIGLPEPIGETLVATELDKGLELYKVSCPIGLIGVIFESRPDALVQISTLCLKSGNAALLKGGREAIETNRILAKIIREASEQAGVPSGWIQLLETREDVNELLKLDKYVDLIIPRGSNSFVQYIMNNSNIAVMGHADGICHTYIDKDADIEMAVKVATDAKTQYVSVCNATETILVHKDVANVVIPKLAESLISHNVEIFGCERTQAIIKCEAVESWKMEYLDYKVSLRVVDSLEQAIEHINTYGSRHTDSIITKNPQAAEEFMNLVDSADVFWNCSTRFADGFRYGLGAEVGISTSKIHARGPVGLEGLTIYKWKLKGNGQIVADYASGKSTFTHKSIDKKFSI
jgi:glutamate-5-semialdehyde dehydrogenase